MIICLVTDRRRADPVDQARHAAAAGIDVVQIRERDLDASALAGLVTDALNAVQGSRTRIVVNDRLDVALACGAHGVHLRSDSIPAARARTIAPKGFLIGRSVHGADEAIRAAADVDYLLAGTIFATESKPAGHALLGVNGLRAVVAAAAGVPVLAIGGVTADRAPVIAGAGAAGIAAIGLFRDPGSLSQTARSLRMRFDSAEEDS
jgi:thiamine-phosphate diphosphorylase